MNRIYLKLFFLLIFFLPSLAFAKVRHAVPDSMLVRTFSVSGVDFKMRYVDAGMFIMGATPEQRSDKISSDRPSHCVSLSHYYIGVTEVTQALWLAVMGEWRSPEEWTDPSCPANWLNWHDAQRFVQRLDSITGLPFRLPTEAEWENAARGGLFSGGYRFAGSNLADSVGWGLMNGGHRVHPVMRKRPNELGLYDMTGNVSEWCQDWFAPYELAVSPDPKGPSEGEERVLRGGSWDNCEDNRHTSYRLHRAPEYMFSDCGLRLAMDVDIPMQKEPEAPAMSIRIKVGKKPVTFRYVAAEQPFYVAETEVSCQQWKEVMNDAGMEKNKLLLTGIKKSEQIEFAEKVRRQSGQAVAVATAEDIEAAKKMGVLVDEAFVQDKSKYYQKTMADQQKHRKMVKNASMWTELVGVRLNAGEDPVLQSFQKDPVEEKPFRLVIRL